MNTKTTVAVAVLALVVGTYYFLFERAPQDDNGTPETGNGQRLISAEDLKPEKVRTIRLIAEGEPLAVLQRDPKDDNEWLQVEPVRFPITGYHARDIVNHTEDLRYSRKFKPSDKAPLDKMGLKPARMLITLESEGDKKTTVALGRRLGAGGAYLMLGDPDAGGDVYVVNDKLHSAVLGKQAKDWRKTSLPSVESGKVRRVEVVEGEKRIELKQVEGRWKLVQPVAGRADRSSTNSLVNAFSSAFIDSFVRDQPADLAPFGLDQPTLVFTLDVVESVETPATEEGKEGEEGENKPTETLRTHTLTIGGPKDLENEKYYATLDDTNVIFTLSKSTLERFQKKPDDLRDPKLTPANRPDVQELTVNRPQAPKLQFLRKDGAWHFGDPDPGYGLDAEQIDVVLGAIFDTEAARYVQTEGQDFTAPLVTAQMALSGKAEKEKLRAFPVKDQADELMVIRNEESTGYIVKRADVEMLFEPALTFRDRTVLDLARDDLVELKIARAGAHPATYSFKRAVIKPTEPKKDESKEDGEDGDDDSESKSKEDAPAAPHYGDWELEGFQAEKVGEVLNQLAPLRATEWLDKTQAVGEGLRIDFATADGKRYKVEIDAKTRAARASGVKTMFTAHPDLVGAIEEELRLATVLELEVEKIASVKSADFTLTRNQDGDYKLEGEAEVDETKAADLFDTLAGLSAAFFVDAGRAKGKPATTLTLSTTDEKAHVLKLWPLKGEEAVAQLGKKTFTLRKADVEKLTVSPVKSAEKSSDSEANEK